MRGLRCSITISQEIGLCYRYLFWSWVPWIPLAKKKSIKYCESFRAENSCQCWKKMVSKSQVKEGCGSSNWCPCCLGQVTLCNPILTLSILRNTVYLVCKPGEFSALSGSCTAWVVWEYHMYFVYSSCCVLCKNPCLLSETQEVIVESCATVIQPFYICCTNTALYWSLNCDSSTAMTVEKRHRHVEHQCVACGSYLNYSLFF